MDKQRILLETYSKFHKYLYVLNTHLLRSIHNLGKRPYLNYNECIENIDSKILFKIGDAIVRLSDVYNFRSTLSELKKELEKLNKFFDTYDINKNIAVRIIIHDILNTLDQMEKTHEMYKISHEVKRYYL